MKILLLFSCLVAFASCKDLLFNNDKMNCGTARYGIANCRENGDENSYCVSGHHCRCSKGFVCEGFNHMGSLNEVGHCWPGVSCIPSESDCTSVDCSDCLIGNECYGYDPSGRAGPPDVETCTIFGIDCSGGAGDSKKCAAENMDCGEGNSLFLGKRNCCEGLTCMSPYGWGRCEKEQQPCRDHWNCHNPGISINGTYVYKSYLEVFPDGCRKLPKNHGIIYYHEEDSLKRKCPKSCGCKKCNYFNKCIE